MQTNVESLRRENVSTEPRCRSQHLAGVGRILGRLKTYNHYDHSGFMGYHLAVYLAAAGQIARRENADVQVLRLNATESGSVYNITALLLFVY